MLNVRSLLKFITIEALISEVYNYSFLEQLYTLPDWAFFNMK
jgi:hypothetical protein